MIINNYKILFEENGLVLLEYTKELKDKKYGKYTFGNKNDINDIYGFPVNQELLKKTQCIKQLRNFIRIGKELADMYPPAKEIQKTYKKMIKILMEAK